MPGRIFLANVGVNASHRAFSPLFADGRFEFVPIPEAMQQGAAPMLTYRDLPSFNAPQAPLSRFVPAGRRGAWVHNDPEFVTFTYGDTCRSSPRAAALTSLQPGDFLFFLARLIRQNANLLTGADGGLTQHGKAGFYLIGFLHIEEVVADLRQPPPARLLRRIAANAHVRQAVATGNCFDGFWVFRGSSRSQRFVRAVPLTRRLIQRLLRDARGRSWRWNASPSGRRRSDLQVIGSYTRACRCILDPQQPGHRARIAAWWRHVAAFQADLDIL